MLLRLFIFFVPILVLSVVCVKGQQVNYDYLVDVDINSRVINTLDDQYVCLTIDTSRFSPNGLTLDLRVPKLKTLLSGLSPTRVRVGGTSCNFIFFDLPTDKLNMFRIDPKSFVMTKQNFLDLVELTQKTNNRLIYDLNYQKKIRNQWDPTDAIRLFEFCKERGLGSNLDFELGNEPRPQSKLRKIYGKGKSKELLHEKDNVGVGRGSANEITEQEETAKDFEKLQKLIQTYENLRQSSVYGPDSGMDGISFLEALVKNHKPLNAYTMHHYYMDGSVATAENYTDPGNFFKLERNLKAYLEVVEKSRHRHSPVWLGETNTGHTSGTQGVSDRFVSGFYWMHNLGTSASMGIKAVFRQSIVGGYYSLLKLPSRETPHLDYEPNPDYWLTWLYRQLVGKEVFNVTISNVTPKDTVKVFAHCVNKNLGKRNAVIVYGFNMNKNGRYKLDFRGKFANQLIHAYFLSPANGDILSDKVLLNGVQMDLVNDISIPQLANPVIVDAGKNVVLAPSGIAFFLFPNIDYQSCSHGYK